MHKYHIINTAEANCNTSAQLSKMNPIQSAYLKAEFSRHKINTLYEAYQINLINQESFTNLFNKLPANILTLLQRHEDNTTAETPSDRERRSMLLPVKINTFKQTKEIKTSNFIKTNYDAEENDNPFLVCRNIKHPRERIIQFLLLHNRFYNNVRLARHKIIESPKCHHCEMDETNEHLFIECHQAQNLWKCIENKIGRNFNSHEKMYGSRDKWLNNIISAAKATLATNRVDPVDTELALTKIDNRIKDTIFIKLNTQRDKITLKYKRDLIPGNTKHNAQN